MQEQDRIEYINELQQKPYKYQKSPSMILNNFFALLTIVVISICVTIYTVYILPSKQEDEKKAKELKAAKELKLKEQKQYHQMRQKQIALSHKLNNMEQNKSNASSK